MRPSESTEARTFILRKSSSRVWPGVFFFDLSSASSDMSDFAFASRLHRLSRPHTRFMHLENDSHLACIVTRLRHERGIDWFVGMSQPRFSKALLRLDVVFDIIHVCIWKEF